MRARSTERAGFTLVEAVVSIALLVLVVAGAYQLLVHSARQVYAARCHYLAANISKSRVERARNFDYADLLLLREVNVVVDADGVPFSDGPFRRTTTIVTNYFPGLTQVSVDTEVRDVRTRHFQGEKETVSCLLTEYLKR
jgi:hypothetical protein